MDVDELLLAGPVGEVVLRLDEAVTRRRLRQLVAERHGRLADAGAGAGSSVAVRLPPSLEYIAVVLAVWRAGAQAILIDHRFTGYEVASCLERLRPQLAVEPVGAVARPMRGFHDIGSKVVALPGGVPAAGGHALIQFSSGSTGPSKIIGRGAEDLVAEVERYTRIDGFPSSGRQVVSLASLTNVLGLVGGLLNSLHTGAELVLPRQTGTEGILRCLAAAGSPAVLLAVPSQLELLARVSAPPPTPLFEGAITGGELLRDELWNSFADRYGVRIGTMYGMTEAGVMATDLSGAHRPELTPAAGHEFRVEDGELLLHRPESPYLGATDPGRWADGWLRTRDAGSVDPVTGRVTVLGRLDSQISVNGLKVDLNEVEQLLAHAPGVTEAVVVHDGAIRAYVALDDARHGTAPVEAWLKERLAPYKRPRAVHALPVLPRTSSGKPVRSASALAEAREGAARSAREGVSRSARQDVSRS
ncbi:class I adenylate-forming enzyme family protein [Streptomyces sp. NPDC007971]|uniref:class I adenylate-forming enzyme family protein n=1 Tax=Streptomyces sp. NPDC007971 TaxID=3364799 RepID=UPI0036EF14B0